MASKKQNAIAKAERIAAAEEKNVTAYREALVAPAKTQARVDEINAGVKAATEASGNVYDPTTAMTVTNQVSINPLVETTQNYSGGVLKDTYTYNESAFDKIARQLNQWGLGSLAETIKMLLKKGYDENSIWNKMKYDSSPMDANNPTGPKWNDAYNKRFAGNVARTKQGLNAYSEDQYLAIEDGYADVFKRNNLSNLLSVDAEANQKKWAGYMTAGLSADELGSRVDTYFERVEKMDPNIKNQFKAYYPGITDTDIVSYLADPENTMPVLRNKITAAEIGAAAIRTGLSATSKSSAEEMAQAGKSALEAETGYKRIGTFLSDAELYSQVYKEEGINYTQDTAERDIIMGNAEATKKRKRLESKARAAFEGSSGRLRTGQAQSNTGSF